VPGHAAVATCVSDSRDEDGSVGTSDVGTSSQHRSHERVSNGEHRDHGTDHGIGQLAAVCSGELRVHASAADQSPHSREEYPKTIRLDNGPEFISKELDLWAFMHDVTLDFSRPGKPTDNAFIESLNGKFRAECLNANWFLSLDEARRKCEAWRRDYNEVRPHSAIGNKVPIMLHRASGNPDQPAAR
jgi:Integrase core domain